MLPLYNHTIQRITRAIGITFLFSFITGYAQAQVTLPRLISDGVVLQRDANVRIWGWASPQENIELFFLNQVHYTKADAEGNWSILLQPQPAGGPYELVIQGKNEIRVSNILFGDVWVCSGQSNMELTMERVREKYAAEISSASNPYIRQFLVPDGYDFKNRHKDVEAGKWEEASPQTILDFSAVAYFFAKEIFYKYKVPIGLINAALGGSPVEAWMSEDVITRFPSAYAEFKTFQNDDLIREIEQSDRQRAYQWYQTLNAKDAGLRRWNALAVNDEQWDEMTVPGYWADDGAVVNGSVWFRKEISVPEHLAGQPATLWLGRIVDQDSVFINGTFIGTTSYQYPPRRYNVRAGVLQKGKNAISVRVISQWDKGGFIPDKPYYLSVGADTIDLRGKWKYKIGAEMPALAGPTFIRWKPVGLFNKMISPLLNFRIKGVLWYQGESNASRPEEYLPLFQTMINDWREKWQQGPFPFLYVQLASFMEPKPLPSESNWAALRNAQLQTLSLAHTGMAVAIDIGEWNDIHPLNKRDVGKRLALQAQVVAYGEKDIVASGPVPAAWKVNNKSVVIEFTHARNGLRLNRGNTVGHLAASVDGKDFFWVQAKIRDNKVIVEDANVRQIRVIRYAWADNPGTANLYNKEGLPAGPFEIVVKPENEKRR